MQGTNLLRKVGRAASRAVGTRTGMGAIAAGAAGLGLARVTAPAARDAAMDVAFGDPDADQTFLGRKLTPTVFTDTMLPGDNSGTQAMGMLGAGTAIGAGVGAFMKRTPRAGVIGGLIGAAAGAMSFAGLTSGYIGRNNNYLEHSPYVGNKRLNRADMSYGGNLYNKRNSSLNTAAELNADGNIVLGLHNLRRGG